MAHYLFSMLYYLCSNKNAPVGRFLLLFWFFPCLQDVLVRAGAICTDCIQQTLLTHCSGITSRIFTEFAFCRFCHRRTRAIQYIVQCHNITACIGCVIRSVLALGIVRLVNNGLERRC